MKCLLITNIPFLAAMLAITLCCLASALAHASSELIARAPSSSDLQARAEWPTQWNVDMYNEPTCTKTPIAHKAGPLNADSDCYEFEAGSTHVKISATGGLGLMLYWSQTACEGPGNPNNNPPIPRAVANCLALNETPNQIIHRWKFLKFNT